MKIKTEKEIEKRIEKILIDSALRVIKSGEGCLFIIKHNGIGVGYELLIINDLKKPFSIFEEKHQKRMDILAKLDGACIIDKGKLIAYGARIKDVRTFHGFGTRNSAAYTASLKGNTAILGSQESKKVRIFKNGVVVMQIDALERGIESKTSQAVSILESVGAGTIGAIGTGILLPTAGVTLLPGIIVFGSSHWILKYLINMGGRHG